MTFVKRTEVRSRWCLSSSLGRLSHREISVWRLVVPLADVTWTPPVVLKPLQRHTCFPKHSFSSYQLEHVPTYCVLISRTDECQTVLSPSSPSHNNRKFVASEDHGMVHAAAVFVLAKPCPSLGCSEESGLSTTSLFG